MTKIQEIMDQLAGKENADALVGMMAGSFEDFAEAREQYEQAMCKLKEELGEGPVNMEAEAIRQQTASNLLFCGLLGIKANLDNFINPMARSFLEVDSEVYLREATAHRLPEYESARCKRNRFYASLSAEQRETYEAAIAYVSYLETVGPKLAHYYGYLLGNEFLHRIIPGYHADPVLTAQYGLMLEDYFGKKLPDDRRGPCF